MRLRLLTHTHTHTRQWVILHGTHKTISSLVGFCVFSVSLRFQCYLLVPIKYIIICANGCVCVFLCEFRWLALCFNLKFAAHTLKVYGEIARGCLVFGRDQVVRTKLIRMLPRYQKYMLLVFRTGSTQWKLNWAMFSRGLIS